MSQDLRSAASSLLAMFDSALVAAEPTRWRRAMTALDQCAAGLQHKASLRAAFELEERLRPPAAAKGTGIAVLPLTGLLVPHDNFLTWLGLATNVTAFASHVRAAVADPTVRSLVVLVDSPGGLVEQIPETAATLREARARKPVLMSVAGMAASAAYWLAANGTRIEATRSANVGSVGVFAERVSVARRLDRDGVDVDVIAAGKFKTEGHAAVAMTDAERGALQGRVDETFGVFVADVAAGRRVLPSVVTTHYGQGRVVSATTALAAGMIDAIATIEQTIGALAHSSTATAAAQRRHELAAAGVSPLRAEQAQRTIAALRRDLEGRA